MNRYYCTNRSESFKDYVVNELEIRRKEILDFFEVEDNENYVFNVYIYDTQEELVKGLLDRGFPKDPDYMCACSKDEDNSLNFFEPKDTSDNEWTKQEYKDRNIVMHEEIHGIQNYIYGKQPEWLTEGIAVYLDGSYKSGIKFLLDETINKRPIPSMYELINEFGLHEYNAYDYSYIIVSYLIEIEGKSNFIKKIYNKDYIKELEESNIVAIAIDYYNKKYYGDNISSKIR